MWLHRWKQRRREKLFDLFVEDLRENPVSFPPLVPDDPHAGDEKAVFTREEVNIAGEDMFSISKERVDRIMSQVQTPERLNETGKAPWGTRNSAFKTIAHPHKRILSWLLPLARNPSRTRAQNGRMEFLLHFLLEPGDVDDKILGLEDVDKIYRAKFHPAHARTLFHWQQFLLVCKVLSEFIISHLPGAKLIRALVSAKGGEQ